MSEYLETFKAYIKSSILFLMDANDVFHEDLTYDETAVEIDNEVESLLDTAMEVMEDLWRNVRNLENTGE